MGSLAQVLRALPQQHDPNLIVGSSSFDDAGVYRISDKLALVQTVDFFPPPVDDAYAFGQIAAANSLSDIYAMGATPLSCLNIVAFPDTELPSSVLSQILLGGQDKVAEAGATIVGGHSIRDSEIKYGLAVTGLVNPTQVITNAGARAGDRLVLTKPIGSGTLTTAWKKGKLPENELKPCIDIMSQLNAPAAQAMIAAKVHAATDVTGFGLIGHASEMAMASKVTLSIDTETVPVMDGALALTEQGVLTRAAKSNRDHVGTLKVGATISEQMINLLADAQTSGGLLMSVSSEAAGMLLAELETLGVQHATMIGEVVSQIEAAVVLN